MLEFKVDNQIIMRKDNFRVVADSKNYLKAHFELSEEWQGDVVALFGYGERVFQVLLEEDNSCSVPFEVIKTPSFYVSLACGTEKLVTANMLSVEVEASGFAEGEEPLEPTPDLWQQYIANMQANIENALPYIGENGHWFLYNAKTRDYEDTGTQARGSKPIKGTDYWTDDDKAEIENYIDQKDFVDKTSEQIIYAKKTFSGGIKVEGMLELPNDETGNVANMQIASDRFQINSTAPIMYFNSDRVLTKADKAEIDTRVAGVEGELGTKASVGDVAVFEAKKADKDTTEWQLIEGVTIAEDVQRVYCDLKGGQYKELYIRFVVPTNNPDKVTDFAKGRSNVYVQDNVQVFNDGNQIYPDNGVTWVLAHHLKMIGKNCITERKMYERSDVPAYTLGSTPARWGHTVGVPLDGDFISELSVNLQPSGTWKFPAGTTYELWGVKA